MERKSPSWDVQRHLTPETFDHYVAKVRAERAKGIAEFYGTIAAWIWSAAAGLISRIAHGRQAAHERRKASAI
jgi:hypothetical protein